MIAKHYDELPGGMNEAPDSVLPPEELKQIHEEGQPDWVGTILMGLLAFAITGFGAAVLTTIYQGLVSCPK